MPHLLFVSRTNSGQARNSFEQDGDKMAAAVPESKSLQERINALHIQLQANNEELDRSKLTLMLTTENQDVPKPTPKPGSYTKCFFVIKAKKINLN